MKFEQAATLHVDRLANYLNYLQEEIEASTGLPGVLPRYRVSKPTIISGSTHFNNIRVDRSVVGAINTGEIARLDIAMDNIRAGGDELAARALQQLTQAVIDSADLAVEDKNTAIDHLSFLANQAARSKEQRQPSIGTTVLQGLGTLLSTAGDVASIFSVVRPALEGLF